MKVAAGNFISVIRANASQFLMPFVRNNILLLLPMIGITATVLLFSPLTLDKNVPDGDGYLVEENLRFANAASKNRYISYGVNNYSEHFGLPWREEPGLSKVIRSGPSDFDDIGYPILVQWLALVYGPLDRGLLKTFHHWTFVVSLGFLTGIVWWSSRTWVVPLIFLPLALILKFTVASYIYGTPDSRTLPLSFPAIVFAGLFLAKGWTAKGSRPWLSSLFFGLITAAMTAIRYPEGLAAFLSLVVCLILSPVSLPKRVALFLTMFISVLFFYFMVPISCAIHKDIVLRLFTAKATDYLRSPGHHPEWHSILAGAGRYPSNLGHRYDDIATYTLVKKIEPSAVAAKMYIPLQNYESTAKRIFFKYLLSSPVEYAGNLARGWAEHALILPYFLETGRLRRSYGYLPAKPGVTVEYQDQAPIPGSLINVTWSTAGLKPWTIFALVVAVASIFLCVVRSWKAVDEKVRTPYLHWWIAALTYLGLLGMLRAMVPVHGFSFLLGFWLLATLALSYLILTFFMGISVKPGPRG